MTKIQDALAKLPDFLAPLRDAASRYAKHPSEMTDAGTLQIGHRPWVAELNYMFMLYPGINQESLDSYCRNFSLQIPEMYVEFLRDVNGAFCFGMSLCGIPPSRLNNPSLLDRSVLQCHDLAMAAKLWVVEYNVPKDYFHFGGRHYSYSKNLAYFVTAQNRIVSVLGKKKVVGEWDSFTSFLSDELHTSELAEEKRRPSKWTTQ